MTTHPEPHERPTPSTSQRTRATVLDATTNGMFRLQLGDGRFVVAHPALDLRKVFTRLLPGDEVEIEISPFDHDRARICSLIKSAVHPPPPQQRR